MNEAEVEKIMQRIYYQEQNFLGRDSLFHIVKQRFKPHPSIRQINAWLKKQELQQLFQGTRSGGGTDRFRPMKPWQNISIDLIDFSQNAAPNAQKYILVCIDNFSRYMYTRTMVNKEAATTAKKLEEILDQIKVEFPSSDIKKIITDDGSEFKGATGKLLEERGIRIQRALGGNPQQNGLVERANGILKLILGKTKKVKGGNWTTHLSQAVKVYNGHYNRATKFSPEEAVRLNTNQQQTLKDNVREAYQRDEVNDWESRKRFEVDDRVRVKLNKGKLDKSSTPNWSETIYKVTKIIPKQGTKAEKYRIDKPDTLDKIYTRNDLQKVDEVEKIPERPAPQRQIKIGVSTRVRPTQPATTRSQNRTTPTTQPTTQPKPKQKAFLKKGDKVLVRYPDKSYEGVVRSYSKNKTVIYFSEDNSEDVFYPQEYNTIKKL